MLLTITNLSKSYGDQAVLNGVSLTLDSNQRIGLVGANGAGKSTMLKIVVGEIEADSGAISRAAGARVGYLPQVIAALDDQTMDDLIADALRHLIEWERRMRELEQRMTGANGHLEAILQEYSEISEMFEQQGGYEIEYRVQKILDGLGIGHLPRDQQVNTLSGGEKARIGLAMLLLQAPDVLLLDEPTNHLDTASLDWLEAYLGDYRGAMLIVSHDRQFLNRTVSAIVEIDEHTRAAKHYTGDYDAYLVAKTQERQRWQEEYERQQEEIKALRLEIKVKAHSVGHHRPPTDRDKFLAYHRQTVVQRTVSRRVSSAEEKLRRIEENPIPKPPDELNFDPNFDPQALKGRIPLMASGLSKSFGGRAVLQEVAFSLDVRSRVVLVGPNGAGKSTLLKILAGCETADRGEIRISPQVKIGYLDQGQDAFNTDETVLDYYRAGLPGEEQRHITLLLASGLFRYDELSRKIGQISSGQKRKLQLARLIAEQANLLLLDEPTNYVSFDVLEALENALRHFPGPVVAVSHDRRFIERFGGEIWTLRDGQLLKP